MAPTDCSPDRTGADTLSSDDLAANRFGELVLSTLAGPDGQVLVTVTGEIDMRTAPDLLSGLGRALDQPGCRTVIVDLGGVGFLGARGIGVLVAARADATARAIRLVLVADRLAVLRPLQITAVTDRLAIFSTVTAARAA